MQHATIQFQPRAVVYSAILGLLKIGFGKGAFGLLARSISRAPLCHKGLQPSTAKCMLVWSQHHHFWVYLLPNERRGDVQCKIGHHQAALACLSVQHGACMG